MSRWRHFLIIAMLITASNSYAYTYKYNPDNYSRQTPSNKHNDMLDFFDDVLHTPEFLFQHSLYPQQAQLCFGSGSQLCSAAYPPPLVTGNVLIDAIKKTIQTYTNPKAGSYTPAQESYWLDDDGGKPDFESIPADKIDIFNNPAEQDPTQNAYVQKIMLPAQGELIVFGDLHGSIHALARMMCKLMADGYLDQNLRLLKPHVYIVFTGDLTDYGRHGAETLFTVLQLRIANPDRILICRGNHEDRIINQHGGFVDEIKRRYTNIDKQEQKILSAVYKFYEHLPYAIFIGIQGCSDEGYAQCCHGGIEPKAIGTIDELLTTPNKFFAKLPAQAFRHGCTGLNWSDFTGSEHVPAIRPSPRGAGVVCSIQGAQEWMERLNIKMILRGHQDMDDYFKVIMRGVVEPQYFFTQSSRIRKELQHVQPSIDALVKTPEAFYKKGFKLGDLPKEDNHWLIAPVFTFTNASASRFTDTEGFGLLTLEQTWENTRIRGYGFTTPLMSCRHLIKTPQNHKLHKDDRARLQAALGVDATLDDKDLFSLLRYACVVPQATYICARGTNYFSGPAAWSVDHIYGETAIKHLEECSNFANLLFGRHQPLKNILERYSVKKHQPIGIDDVFKQAIRK